MSEEDRLVAILRGNWLAKRLPEIWRKEQAGEYRKKSLADMKAILEKKLKK